MTETTDPNAEPSPAELAEWWALDLAAAVEWGEGRLTRAHQLGDVEIAQHLGLLLKAAARVAELEADLLKIEGFRADLADRCFRMSIELDELRTRGRTDR